MSETSRNFAAKKQTENALDLGYIKNVRFKSFYWRNLF